MNTMTKVLGAAVVLSSTAFSMQVEAAPYLSTFTFVDVGSPTQATYSPSPGGLGNATQVTFGSNIMTVGSGGAWQSGNGVAIQNTTVQLGTSSATSGTIANNTFTWTAGGVNFTFISNFASYNSTSQTTTNASNNTTSTTDFINLSYFGNLTNTSVAGALSTQSGVLSASFSSSGPNSSVSESGTFVTPAPVPEPVSMMLLGTGLVGLLAARRRV